MQFVAANPSVAIVPDDQTAATVTIATSADSAQWQQVYPGIDLSYAGDAGRLKSAYHVAPGADPATIRWQYTGIEQVTVDAATGDLHLTLPPAPTGALTPTTIVERAPVAWQDSAGVRVPVAVQYVVYDDRSVGFAVGSYDPAIALMIDPEVVSGSFGGNGYMQARDHAIDSISNRAYIAGSVYNGQNDGVLITVNTTTLQQEDIFISVATQMISRAVLRWIVKEGCMSPALRTQATFSARSNITVAIVAASIMRFPAMIFLRYE